MMYNILIIDDKEKKIDELTEVLKGKTGTLNVFPTEAELEGFSGKIQELANPDMLDDLYFYIKDYVENQSIHAIILDFYLDGNESYSTIPIERTDGYALLKKIRNSSDKFAKIPIYSFTRGEASLKNGQTLSASGKIQGYVPKTDNIGDDMTNQILFNIQYECEKYKDIHYCDIAVVCALKSELEAIRQLLRWEEFVNDERVYYKGKLNNYTVIATSEDKMGMAEAATLTTRVIENFDPKYVVMTGIAAGINNKDQGYLDLLMPDYIFNWQSGKYKVKQKSDNIEEKTIHLFEKDYRSEDTFLKHSNIVDENGLSDEIVKQLDFNNLSLAKPEKINTYKDGMVSGSAVVADSKIVSEGIVERKINGIDMEAYGVVFACNNAPSRPKPIIIKSISDFADEDKGDKYQEAARQVSAKAFYILFTEFIKSKM